MKCRCCSWHLEVAATHSLIRRKKLKQQEVLWPRLAGFSKAPQQFFETTTSFTALISPLPHIFAHTLRNYRVIMSNCILWFLSDILIHSLISKDVPSYYKGFYQVLTDNSNRHSLTPLNHVRMENTQFWYNPGRRELFSPGPLGISKYQNLPTFPCKKSLG